MTVKVNEQSVDLFSDEWEMYLCLVCPHQIKMKNLHNNNICYPTHTDTQKETIQ